MTTLFLLQLSLSVNLVLALLLVAAFRKLDRGGR